MKNRKLNMNLKSLWFKQGEFNRLVSAVECNNKDEVFDILFEMKKRGDLK